MLIGRSGPLDAQSDLIGAPEPMRIGALLAAPNERLGAQLFDAEQRWRLSCSCGTTTLISG